MRASVSQSATHPLFSVWVDLGHVCLLVRPHTGMETTRIRGGAKEHLSTQDTHTAQQHTQNYSRPCLAKNSWGSPTLCVCVCVCVCTRPTCCGTCPALAGRGLAAAGLCGAACATGFTARWGDGGLCICGTGLRGLCAGLWSALTAPAASFTSHTHTHT